MHDVLIAIGHYYASAAVGLEMRRNSANQRPGPIDPGGRTLNFHPGLEPFSTLGGSVRAGGGDTTNKLGYTVLDISSLKTSTS